MRLLWQLDHVPQVRCESDRSYTRGKISMVKGESDGSFISGKAITCGS